MFNFAIQNAGICQRFFMPYLFFYFPVFYRQMQYQSVFQVEFRRFFHI